VCKGCSCRGGPRSTASATRSAPSGPFRLGSARPSTVVAGAVRRPRRRCPLPAAATPPPSWWPPPAAPPAPLPTPARSSAQSMASGWARLRVGRRGLTATRLGSPARGALDVACATLPAPKSLSPPRGSAGRQSSATLEVGVPTPVLHALEGAARGCCLALWSSSPHALPRHAETAVPPQHYRSRKPLLAVWQVRRALVRRPRTAVGGRRRRGPNSGGCAPRRRQRCPPVNARLAGRPTTHPVAGRINGCRPRRAAGAPLSPRRQPAFRHRTSLESQFIDHSGRLLPAQRESWWRTSSSWRSLQRMRRVHLAGRAGGCLQPREWTKISNIGRGDGMPSTLRLSTFTENTSLGPLVGVAWRSRRRAPGCREPQHLVLRQAGDGLERLRHSRSASACGRRVAGERG